MITAASQTPCGGNYLVFVHDSVVAQDIGQAILVHDPYARILNASTLDDAVAVLSDVPTVTVALMSLAPETFVGSGLADAISMRGGQTVLIDAHQPEPGSLYQWRGLEIPFSDEALRGLLTLSEAAA